METGLDWPNLYYEINENYRPEYKQPFEPWMLANAEDIELYKKGSNVVNLGRWLGEVPDAIINLLNKFNPSED